MKALCVLVISVRSNAFNVNAKNSTKPKNISGGPLLINGILVGVSSFRNGPVCESVEGKFPNIYTDVSLYVIPFDYSKKEKAKKLISLFFQINWIERHTGIDYQLNMFLQRKA